MKKEKIVRPDLSEYRQRKFKKGGSMGCGCGGGKMKMEKGAKVKKDDTFPMNKPKQLAVDIKYDPQEKANKSKIGKAIKSYKPKKRKKTTKIVKKVYMKLGGKL